MPGVLRLSTIIGRHFKITRREAQKLIGEGRVRVNGKIITAPSEKLEFWDEVHCDGELIRAATKFTYIKLNKPAGIESTTNTAIPGHLLTLVDHPAKLHAVGRLDKASEGLMLLTDDGRLFANIANSERHQEKEYVVTVDQSFDEDFLRQMREGVKVMGQVTRPAKVWREDKSESTFRIVLTQGLNRQIRRMCFKLGYEVIRLRRVRIAEITLGELQPGEWEMLGEKDLNILFASIS